MAIEYHNFIDGKWVPSGSGERFENRNPAKTSDLIGEFQKSTAADAAAAIDAARAGRGRVVALGTTVTRALEHAALRAGGDRERLPTGPGLADQRLGRDTTLRVVDVIVSGTHEPGTSHHELLKAFVDPRTLREADRALETRGYRTHEFGDSVLVERKFDPGPPSRLRRPG